MRTSSRIVALVLFDEVELLDAAIVASVLSTSGRQWNYRPFKVVAVSAVPGMVTTRSQLRVETETTFADSPAPEIVVVPGGYGARRAAGDAAVVDDLRRVGPAATHLFGIGHGVLALAAAGLVENVDVSIAADGMPLLAQLSTTARADAEARFRQSGKVLTAQAAGGAVDASLHLVGAILGKKQADAVALALGLSWSGGDPVQVRIVERDS